MSNLDSVQEVWTSLGIVVRLAMLMGYHRDAKQLPGITAFDGEMRRRTWAVIQQLDLLSSFQMGLPSLVQADASDAELPRNLLDDDFDELTPHLPASRPDTESTDILYFIVKSRILGIVQVVVRTSLSLRAVSCAEVKAVDTQLRRVHELTPPSLRRRPVSKSFTDPTQLIVARINCELLFQKGLCVLHRKYLNDDPGHSWSRETCTSAALTILEIQAELQELSLRGGQLSRDRWLLSSITLHDFLLAATIICMDLSQMPGTVLEAPSTTEVAFEDKLGALQRAHAIFKEQSAYSKQARRCTDAIGYMLPRIETKLAERVTSAELANNANQQGDLREDPTTASERPQVRPEAISLPNESEIVDWVSQDRSESRMPISTADLSGLVTSGPIPKLSQLRKRSQRCMDRPSRSRKSRA